MSSRPELTASIDSIINEAGYGLSDEDKHIGALEPFRELSCGISDNKSHSMSYAVFV